MPSSSLPFAWRVGAEQGLRREFGSGRFPPTVQPQEEIAPFFPWRAAADRALNNLGGVLSTVVLRMGQPGLGVDPRRTPPQSNDSTGLRLTIQRPFRTFNSG